MSCLDLSSVLGIPNGEASVVMGGEEFVLRSPADALKFLRRFQNVEARTRVSAPEHHEALGECHHDLIVQKRVHGNLDHLSWVLLVLLRHIGKQLLLRDHLLVQDEAPKVKLVNRAGARSQEEDIAGHVDGEGGDGAGDAVEDRGLHPLDPALLNFPEVEHLLRPR